MPSNETGVVMDHRPFPRDRFTLAEEASWPFMLTSYPVAACQWRTAGVAVPNLWPGEEGKKQRKVAAQDGTLDPPNGQGERGGDAPATFLLAEEGRQEQPQE